MRCDHECISDFCIANCTTVPNIWVRVWVKRFILDANTYIIVIHPYYASFIEYKHNNMLFLLPYDPSTVTVVSCLSFDICLGWHTLDYLFNFNVVQWCFSQEVNLFLIMSNSIIYHHQTKLQAQLVWMLIMPLPANVLFGADNRHFMHYVSIWLPNLVASFPPSIIPRNRNLKI